MTNELAKEKAHNYTIESKDEILVVKNKNNKPDIEMEVILFNSEIINKINDYVTKSELDRNKHNSIIKNIIDIFLDKFK